MKKNGRKSTNIVGSDGAGHSLSTFASSRKSGGFARSQLEGYKNAKALGVYDQVKEMDKPEFRERLKADAKKTALEGRRSNAKENLDYFSTKSEHLRDKTPIKSQKLGPYEKAENELEGIYRKKNPERVLKNKSKTRDPAPRDFSFFEHKQIDKSGRKK